MKDTAIYMYRYAAISGAVAVANAGVVVRMIEASVVELAKSMAPELGLNVATRTQGKWRARM